MSMGEMILIFLLALVVVGPKKLPELARQLGKYMAEFKRASNEFKRQLEDEMLNIELEERAKKAQEAQKVLPAESNLAQAPLTPGQGIVSRGSSEDISAAVESPPPEQTAEPKPLPSANAG